MQAVILAAGSGRRMLPLTVSTHKTLLPVAGRPIIDRLIDGLRENEILNIVLVTGYRADELEAHVLEEHPDVDFTFVRNMKYDSTNNVLSLAMAFDRLEIDEDIVLLESDLIFEPKVLTRLIKSPADNVALVDRYRIGNDGTVVALSEDGVVREVIAAAMQGADFKYSDKYKTLNIYKFSAEFARGAFRALLSYYAETIDEKCYYELILGMLIYMGRIEVHGEVLDGELWAEVDDPNDLRVAEFLFDKTGRQRHLAETWGGYWNLPVRDFAFIRNMHFPSPSMISQMKAYFPAIITNYGSSQNVLNQKLANYLQCRASSVELLNGASQFFPILRDWFDGRRVLLPSPTFGEYERIFPEAERYADDGDFDLSGIGSRLDDCDLLVLVNPNNPTGTCLGSIAVREVVAAAQQCGTRVLIDESFIDFSGEESVIPWLEAEGVRDVIVLKSLSKSLGVPGMRLGFAYCADPAELARLRQDIPVWNSNSMAEHFLELLLKYPSELTSSYESTVVDREWFAKALREVALVERVYESGGNFLLVQLDASAEVVAGLESELLLRWNIYVKNVSGKLDNGGQYWRIAVRDHADNQVFVEALRRLVDEASGARLRAGRAEPSRSL